MMWARVDSAAGGTVLELTDLDPAGRFHEGLIWVTCPTGTTVGELFDGTNFTQPPAPAPVVPDEVSIVQATLALHATPGSSPTGTLLDDVNAAVSASTDPRIQLAWSRATTLDRRGLFVTQMAPGLGLTDDKLDALFIAAAQIKV